MPAALIAALAAFAATLGDFLMLYVSNSRLPELGLAAVPVAWLWVGAVLGVVGIPFYALGYHAASRILGAISRRAARAFFLLGGFGALLGAVIHGLTALQIHADLEAGAAAQDPLSSIAGWGSTLLALWGLAAVLVIAASVLFGALVTRGGDPASRFVGLANPALVTIALVVLGMSTPLLRAFLMPAAPNLAHLVFFGACAWVQRTGRLASRRS